MRRTLLALVLFVFTAHPAVPQIVIDSPERGGPIGRHIQVFEQIRASGKRVIVDADCMSACTLMLGILPPSQFCATQRARFGFHAAWRFDEHSRQVQSKEGTDLLMAIYPPKLRTWIRRKGGLNGKIIWLRGKSLMAFAASCPRGTADDHRAQAR